MKTKTTVKTTFQLSRKEKEILHGIVANKLSDLSTQKLSSSRQEEVKFLNLFNDMLAKDLEAEQLNNDRHIIA